MTPPTSDSTLAQWLQWLELLHPKTIELGLERVSQVFDRLALDFNGSKIITVAGTNGKGSSVAMLCSILQAAGFSTGAYTSPHLINYNERVSLNGIEAPDADLCAAFAAIEAVRDEVSLTYFEYGTLAAFQYFASKKPDVIVLEVGLGGRLDAVNIMEPDVCILTNVALDHQDWLGDTREAIGFEKAGIFRQGRPAIYGESDMPDSVRAHAQRLGAGLLHKGEQYHWSATEEHWEFRGMDGKQRQRILNTLPINGFPLDNAAAVVQALLLLEPDIAVEHIISGLQSARVAGRFQELEYQSCKVILDVAHNPHAAANLALNIRNRGLAPEHVTLVIAMLGDKDSASVVNALAPLAAKIYTASLGGERGSDAKIIYNHALRAGASSVAIADSVAEAFANAVADAVAGDTILVTGSFFTVAAVLEQV